MLLYAMCEGLVSMHWDVRCPVCGNIDHRHTELGDLQHDEHCPMCHSSYSPHLDTEVFITFSAHQRLRELSARANDLDFRKQIDDRLGVVSGLTMLTLPEFHRLFPQQRLLPDESVDVTRVALIFTDLAGSTALYARRGDPRAYHLVRLHFDALFFVVDGCGGAVVKTIGDAILAVFQTPYAALEAAFAMQQAITDLNDSRGLVGDERLILKLGLHSGPCLNVTLNDRPDYFGSTVNIAARVQGVSKGNDIVFTEAIYNEPSCAPLLENCSLQCDHVRLKGIEGETLVYQLSLDER
jgi:class 3 adenylate cyclase